SRRRHTRFSRDWSSDVCSSDLIWAPTSKGTRICMLSPNQPPAPSAKYSAIIHFPPDADRVMAPSIDRRPKTACPPQPYSPLAPALLNSTDTCSTPMPTSNAGPALIRSAEAGPAQPARIMSAAPRAVEWIDFVFFIAGISPFGAVYAFRYLSPILSPASRFINRFFRDPA